MKSLVFYICLIAGFGFTASMPNKDAIPTEPKTPNIAPKRPKSTNRRNDTTPQRLPDERMSVASGELRKSADGEVRWVNFDLLEGYKFHQNTEGGLEQIELLTNDWNGAFDVRKSVNVKMLFFPNVAGNGKVISFGAFPVKQFTVKIPVKSEWYGHYLLQFTQEGTECLAEYQFWLHSPDNFTKVIYFKPDYLNCKNPPNGK
jgi:hypothetical protein